MKVLVEKDIGGDGAKAGVYIEGGLLAVKASVPVAFIVEKVVAPLDPLKEKLKTLIPGDWDSPLIDGAFALAKEQITKTLSE